jgi:hypothetical protein
MEDEPLEGMITPTYYEFEFDCSATPMQTRKFTGKHLISLDGEDEPAPERSWLIPASVGTAALIVGILIGRFLIP